MGMAVYKSWFLLLIMCFFSSVGLYGGNDEKKHVPYYIPIPDKLPPALRSHRNLKRLAEPVLLRYRRASTKKSNCYGIDVSRYQGNINWSQVSKDKRVSYVYLKATEGVKLVDPTYKSNHRAARKAGIPVGAYHFFSPTASAHHQLSNFKKNVDLRSQDLIPVVDVEVAPRRKSHVLPFLRRLRTFINGIEKHYGCKPIIYTSVNFYNDYLSGRFSDCAFMFARYSDKAPRMKSNVRFLIWQFTDSGRIKGIVGDVDRSCLMGNYSIEDIRYRRKRK